MLKFLPTNIKVLTLETLDDPQFKECKIYTGQHFIEMHLCALQCPFYASKHSLQLL